MSASVSTQIDSLIRGLEVALAVAGERHLQAAEGHLEQLETRTEHRDYVAEVCSRPSPFVSPEEAEQASAATRQRLLDHPPEERFATQLEQQVRWETALCDTDDVLRRLYALPELSGAVEQIAGLVRECRLVSAAGPEHVSPQTRSKMGDYLRDELAWSKGRLKELEALPPDVSEEEVAPAMREGMMRSADFMDRLYGYLGEQQQARERWEAARVRPLEEALAIARSLIRANSEPAVSDS